MALDLEILERKLDDALAKETPESLMKFLSEIRAQEIEAEKKAEGMANLNKLYD